MNMDRPRRQSPLTVASWVVAGLGSAAILVGAFSPDGGIPARERLERDVARIEGRNQELRLANAALRARIRAAERDPETLEWQARSQLHFVRDTDLVFRLPNGPDRSAPEQPPAGGG
ncbi:MAG: septum formation initiator family protein [Deltaproteobacteria bacterium]|nr:septum formation initiator family protein [Deltaproteobacteria bacterium]